MATWTTGAAGWALLGVEGGFVTVDGGYRSEPEGALVYRSREVARVAAKGFVGGLRLVQLLSVAAWEAKYPLQAVAA